MTGPDGEPIGSFSTNAEGEILIPLTLSGLYTVTEEIPSRYHLLPEEDTQQVTVRYGETAEVTFWNEPYGELRVVKVDADTGDELYGARIQIKHIESGATYTGTTDTGGSYTFTELKPGRTKSWSSPPRRAGSATPRPIPPPLSPGTVWSTPSRMRPCPA